MNLDLVSISSGDGTPTLGVVSLDLCFNLFSWVQFEITDELGHEDCTLACDDDCIVLSIT